MASKYREITIRISNDELNKMEDYLVCKLSKLKKETYRKKCIQIWRRLVKEWDSNSKTFCTCENPEFVKDRFLKIVFCNKCAKNKE